MNKQLTATTTVVELLMTPISGINKAAPITEVAITPEPTFACGPKSSRARL